jgi:predicted ATP-dependent serine protease
MDSIQTIHSSQLESAPGSVAQVRECAYKLAEFCKRRDIPLFIVGQITAGAFGGASLSHRRPVYNTSEKNPGL